MKETKKEKAIKLINSISYERNIEVKNTQEAEELFDSALFKMIARCELDHFGVYFVIINDLKVRIIMSIISEEQFKNILENKKKFQEK